jgi:heparosan-N-sulfate-glucuronate 5-epimerase
MPHTYAISPPWLSAMAQGECASLLVRIAAAGGGERYAEAARRALGPMRVAVADGGVRTELRGLPFVEEYPTEPGSYVLNGAIFALWGLRDVGLGLGDAAATAEYEQLTDALASSIGRWDLGFWSRYDLYPHPIPNVASGAYHVLHVTQLKAMQVVSPRPQFAWALERYERYAGSRLCEARAFAQKVVFRLLVPRRRMVQA